MDNRISKIEELKEIYFNADTSPKDKLEVKSQLEQLLSKEELDEFQYELHLSKALEEQEKKILKQKISSFNKDNNVPVIIISYRRMISIAAVFALAAFGIYNFAFQNDSNVSNGKYLALLEDFQKESSGKLSLRGNGTIDNFKDSLKTGINLSMEGKYIESNVILATLLESKKRNELVLLHLSINDYMQENYDKLEGRLTMLIETDNRFVSQESEMLHVQLYLNQDMDENAKLLLKRISSERNHKYSPLAKEYLKNKI